MSKFWDKFWDKVERIFEPLGNLFEKGEFLLKYLIPIFAVAGDFSVAYSIYYFIKFHFDWYLIPLVLFVCIPVLIPFNKYGYEIVKSWFIKEKRGDENTF